jgi:3-oxoacyl-[acyl-carrier protein] reductase
MSGRPRFEPWAIPGRVALVTAASEGLGRACARALALAGAEVAILSRDRARIEATASELAEETGARVVGLVGDLAERGAGTHAVAETARALGPVEILVANVGGPPAGDFDRLDDGAWDAAIAGVLRPAIELSRAVLPRMRVARFGRIVHLLSLTVREIVPGLTSSNALRPAVAGLVADLARANAVHGITVNGVCTGYTRTRRIEELGSASPERLRLLEENIPAARIADPEEIAAVAHFLATDAASYVNGALVPVDGGASARPS